MIEIKLNNLSKNLDQEAVVKNLNLTIKSGEMMALLGPSGCGKTTTLKLIAGLLRPDQGDILFDGNSVKDVPAEEREAVLVFQDYLLFPHLSVGENIAFGLKMAGWGKKKRLQRVDELLKLVDLKGYENHRPQNLSGGEKQRVALARALAINPGVLLLDEPLTNLDTSLRQEMQDFIKKIHKNKKMTSIFVTHDQQEAMVMADRIAVMNNGIIQQCAVPEILYKKPCNYFVADFLGITNYFDVELNGSKIFFEEIELMVDKSMLAPGINAEKPQQLKLMLRPEFITLKDKKDRDMLPEGKIIDHQFMGEKTIYQVKISRTKDITVTELDRSTFSTGDKVWLEIDQDNLWFLPA